MIKYKVDPLTALREKGYSTYRIRKENLFGESTVAKLRKQDEINFANLNKLCALLECQPGDLLEFVSDQEDLQ